MPDARNMLCIHLLCAAENLSDELLQWMLEQNADTEVVEMLQHADEEGKLPIHHLCASKRLASTWKQLEAMIEFFPQAVGKKVRHCQRMLS